MKDEIVEPIVRPEFNAIPAPIIKAISALKKELQAVPKTGINKFGGYNYTSIDDVYAIITKRMGELGLCIFALEVDSDVTYKGTQKGEAAFLKATYQFVLAVEETSWTHPMLRRSILVQVTGPQTFMAAQSFVEKTFYRSLFQIATGDVELDAMAQADTVEEQVEAQQPVKKKSSYAAKKDGTTDVYNRLERGIRQAQTAEALREWKKMNAAEISQLPTNWEQHLNDQYTYRLEDLTAAMGKV